MTLVLKQYFILLSCLSSFLCGSFAFLPHLWSWFSIILPQAQRSSVDRPEHPFLTPLTSRPLVTMVWDVLGMAVCIAWWGQRLKGWWGQSVKPPQMVNKLDEQMETTGRRLFEAAQCTLGGACLFTALLFGLGAPLGGYICHTFLLSLHLSILLVWPPIYALGIPSIYDDGLYARYRLTKLFCEFRADTSLDRTLVYPAIGAVCGAWFGAYAIPLDWDRPWQSYPLPPTVGSILGFIVGGYGSWACSAFKELLTDVAQTEAQPTST